MALSDLLSWILPSSVIGLVVWTLFLVGVLRISRLLFQRWEEDKLLKDFPRPPAHWLLGNSHEIATDSPGYLVNWLLEYGSPYCVRLDPFRSAIVLSDPESMRIMFATNEPKEDQLYNILRGWIGDGLLLSSGKKWARNRRLLTPAFHFQILKPYVGTFSSCTNIMINKWKNSMKHGTSNFELFEHISLMVLDSLLKCAYGATGTIQYEGKGNNFIRAVKDLSLLMMERFGNPLIHSDFVYNLTYNGYKHRQACKTVHQFSQDVIQAKKSTKQDLSDTTDRESKTHLDFLDILLEAKDADGSGLTDTEIQHEVDTFMFEGHDTTASALSWFLYNMAKHQSYQTKCAEEIQSVLGDRDDVTWDDLPRLEFLTMCIKESLRKNPTVTSVERRLTQQIMLPNGKCAPKGVCVILGIWGLHHNPEIWDEPDKYNPLRFTTEKTKNRSPHAFLPFAAGPRNCIGQHFAMLELKTCGALLLKHFEFSVYEEPVAELQLVLRAKDGIRLSVKERR